MQDRTVITLNPTKLTPKQANLLDRFLLEDERRKKDEQKRVFVPGQKYPFKDGKKNIDIEFTHVLSRKTVKLPEISYKEYRYIVHQPVNIIYMTNGLPEKENLVIGTLYVMINGEWQLQYIIKNSDDKINEGTITKRQLKDPSVSWIVNPSKCNDENLRLLYPAILKITTERRNTPSYIGGGNFADVLDVEGIVKHDLAEGRVQYLSISKDEKKKFRAMKRQKIKNKTNNEDKYNESIRWLKHESDIGQKVPHLKIQKTTYQREENEITNSYTGMKKITGITLKVLLGNDKESNPQLSLETRLQLSINLIQALQEQIHAAGIIHRDIKPENIIVDPKTLKVKIIDIGLSIVEGQKEGAAGTPDWMAPETIGEFLSVKESDTWSLGRILRELFGDNIREDEKNMAKRNRIKIQALRKLQYHKDVSMPKSRLSSTIKESISNTTTFQNTVEIISSILQILDNMTDRKPNNRSALKEHQNKLEIILLELQKKQHLANTILAANELRDEFTKLKFSAMKKRWHEKDGHLFIQLPNFENFMRYNLSKHQVQDNPVSIQAFTKKLGIKALLDCENKDSLLAETKKIADGMKETLQMRANLRSVILKEIALINTVTDSNVKKRLKQQLAAHITLFKKKRHFTLDKMAKLNKQYKVYFNLEKNAKISTKTVTAQLALIARSGKQDNTPTESPRLNTSRPRDDKFSSTEITAADKYPELSSKYSAIRQDAMNSSVKKGLVLGLVSGFVLGASSAVYFGLGILAVAVLGVITLPFTPIILTVGCLLVPIGITVGVAIGFGIGRYKCAKVDDDERAERAKRAEYDKYVAALTERAEPAAKQAESKMNINGQEKDFLLHHPGSLQSQQSAPVTRKANEANETVPTKAIKEKKVNIPFRNYPSDDDSPLATKIQPGMAQSPSSQIEFPNNNNQSSSGRFFYVDTQSKADREKTTIPTENQQAPSDGASATHTPTVSEHFSNSSRKI